MVERRRKVYGYAARGLSVIWLCYYLLQSAAELGGLRGLVSWPLPLALAAADAVFHLTAAVLLVVTAYGYYARSRSLMLVGAAALIKAGAYFLRLFSPHLPPLELATEALCCLLLVAYAACCYDEYHRHHLIISIELVLLVIGCIGSLLGVLEQGVLINHAAVWMVVLTAVLEPLGGVVMLLLNVGYHHRKE